MSEEKKPETPSSPDADAPEEAARPDPEEPSAGSTAHAEEESGPAEGESGPAATRAEPAARPKSAGPAARPGPPAPPAGRKIPERQAGQDRKTPKARRAPEGQRAAGERNASERPEAGRGPKTGEAGEPAVSGPAPAAAPAAAPVPSAAPAAAPAAESAESASPEPTGRQRLMAGLWPPRVTRAQLTAALLLCVLGLALTLQVRSNSETSPLRGARQEDLVRILDELDDRTQRLEDEKQRLEDQRTELENSSDQAEEARRQTAQKEQQLGVLAGTVAAQGPGIEVTVGDPRRAVEADLLLDAIQELRAAGAEAIQINDVRVVADSYFTGVAGDVRIDGRKVRPPYRFKAIGRPQDLEPALNIPGGVVQTLEKEQASVSVTRPRKVVVDALRPTERPDYARSSSR